MKKTVLSTKLTRAHVLERDEAVARIVRFTQRFGEAHFILACHAAFPLALTPDLLYQIWVNFVPQAPWTAVSDVLLSPLCQEGGYELYEMDTTIRTILREELEGDQNFGQNRLYALSGFLTEYAVLQLNSDDPDVRDLGKSHQWTSLAYTQPGEAARELAQALLNLGPQDKSELLQIAALMETLAVPLARFYPLLTYAHGIADLIRGDRKGARSRFREALGSTSKLEVAGMSLPIPEWVISEIDRFESADLIAHCPYVLSGPTAGDMFFGREKVLQEIATNINKVSYALTGGRRIGKTSILMQLHRNVLPAAGFQTIYHDCMITPTHESFLSAKIHDVQAKSLSPAIKTIGDLLESQIIKSQVVLLLDEADALISSEADAGWPLFSQLRMASEKSGIRFIFSAYQPFQESLHNPENPLFNSVKQVNVGLLDARAVKDLVIHPMQELGIELVDENEIVQRIYNFTSGHPNIVQRLCYRLIESLVEQSIYSISPADIDQITQNKQFLQNDYLSIYWESATPLEKIVSLLMATNDACRIPQTVRQAIKGYCGLSIQHGQIVDALERLVSLRYILKRKGTKYVFAANAFPSVIESIVPVQDMLMTLQNEYYEIEDEKTRYNNHVKEEKSISTSKVIFNPNAALLDGDVTYIQRRGDNEALARLKSMDYIVIAEPFRQGKTSLINHLMSHPQLGNFCFVYIDTVTLDHSSSELWYQSLCSRILQQLHFVTREEYPPVAQSSFEWRQFMLFVGKSAMSARRNIVIVLDEIPVHIPDSTYFFSIIRSLYNEREVWHELGHITFLLAGILDPEDLITDEAVSPFNIAYQVHLADFTQEEVEDLVSRGTWTTEVIVPELSKRIYYWTDGHPYLTQLLCSYLKPDATPDDVDVSVDRLIHDNTDLLPAIFTQLKDSRKLRDYVARIQTGERLELHPREYRIHSQLRLLGLVKADEEGFCTLRNRVYERILEEILPESTAFEASRCLAISVGIDRFSDPALANLPVCVNDATAISRILEKQWYFNDVKLLVDEDATRVSVLAALQRVTEIALESDLLLFYYSGHGVVTLGSSHIVTYDTRVRLIEKTAIPLTEILGILSRSKSRAKLIIVDADFDISRVSLSENLAILASFSPGEHSYLRQDLNHGVFTYFLIEALNGEADVDLKGFVTLNDVFKYVSVNLATWSAQSFVKQTPFIRQAVSDIVLIPNKVETLVRLVETSDSILPVAKHQAMEELCHVAPETAKAKLVQWVIAPIAHEEWESAVQILQQLDIQIARDALAEALKHHDSGVRWNAAGRLAEIADTPSWEYLQRAYRVESDAALRSYLYEILSANTENQVFIVEEHILRFIQNVTPTETEKGKLLDVLHSLRESLSRISDFRNIFIDIQVFGSMARGTAIRSTSDIDVLVLFRDSSQNENPKPAYEMLETALKRIYKDQVLDKAILRRTPRQERFFSSFGASIIVDLPQCRLEVLPAVTSNGQTQRILVPDRLLRKWIPTNHEIHARFTFRQEHESNGLYSSLVKAIKHWQYFQTSGQKYLSGFVLECLVAACMEPEYHSLLVYFSEFMKQIQQKYQTYRSMLHVPELGVPSGSKRTNLKQKGYSQFMSVVNQTIELTEKAQSAESLDEKLEIWSRVFGPEFPRKLS